MSTILDIVSSFHGIDTINRIRICKVPSDPPIFRTEKKITLPDRRRQRKRKFEDAALPCCNKKLQICPQILDSSSVGIETGELMRKSSVMSRLKSVALYIGNCYESARLLPLGNIC